MKLDRLPQNRSSSSLKAVWYVLIPGPLLLACRAAQTDTVPYASLTAALCASLALVGMAVLYEHHCNRARILGFLALIGCAIAGLHYFSTEPILALAGGVALIQAGYFLVDMPPCPAQGKELEDNQYTLAVVRNGLYALLGLAPLSFFLNPNHLVLGEQAVAVAVLFAQFFIGLHLKNTATSKKSPWWWILPAILSGGTFLAIRAQLTALAAVISSLLTLLILPASQKGLVEHREKWWEPFLNHPARALITTFFALCLLGTLLLQLPWSATGQQLSFINAAFTSVSAVCVTGLTVVDTQLDFTVFGQLCLLLLIQLGGLGIMTITTVALHALGKRLSLRQERLLTTLTETSHQELIHSLVTIVKFTLMIETIGALLLACGFFLSGSSWSNALWKGVFTSVSAFCNAGFALDASNLLPYQHQPLILYPVSVLIIFGGLAPSTCILVPRWIRGRRIDLAPRVALVTTATLLGIGACSFLVFEWDHALDGLSFADKLTNAWFQSVTLRTAGFNSVDLSGVLSPTLLVMLFSMFIGGSPGGTAGGIKTTTLGILVLTFWATITGQNSVIAQNRRIPQTIINRTITVFFAGGIVWLTVVLALALTQEIPTRQLIFEATSALGTVGLTLGATSHLDVIGKIIIMLTMFIGRIGPMTLFTLLSAEHQGSHSRYPDARISLS